MIKKYDNIDTLSIAFYVAPEGEQSSLLVLRNKKIINKFSGESAEKLYKMLIRGKFKN